MTTRYELYGLTVDAHRQLYADGHSTTALGPADVRMRFAPTEIPSRAPEGDDLLLRFVYDDVDYFCERKPDGSYAFVVTDACEFRVSADLHDVVVHRHVGAEPGIENILASGAQMAWQLYMRGSLVLHASAVQTAHGAVGFVGSSGQGKSTMATLMCAAGGRILTDDLLRVDFIGGTALARRGSSELRLRKGADTLAGTFAGVQPGRRTSEDGRQVLRPPARADDAVPLRALFIPVPDRESDRVRIEELPASEALFALLRIPRLYGWIDETVRRRQFELSSRLLRTVQVSVVHVPWGPPFSDAIAAEVMAAASAASPTTATGVGVSS